jgi:small subunit ribosomal protein S6
MPETQLGVHPPRAYETIYVMRPDVAQEAAAKVSHRVQEVVEREGGKLTLVETWGRRQLAYPVKKFKRGVYVYVQYVSGGGLVSELERNLRMLDEVIKFQTVVVGGEVDVAALEIDPELVQFADIEPPPEDEVEESLERSLGLEEAPPPAKEQHAAEPARGEGAGDKEKKAEASTEKQAEASTEKQAEAPTEKKSEASTEESTEEEE